MNTSLQFPGRLAIQQRLPRPVLRGAGSRLRRRVERVRRAASAGRADCLRPKVAGGAARPGPQPSPVQPGLPFLPMLARWVHRLAEALAAKSFNRGSQPALS
jgi:hypothetical protein